MARILVVSGEQTGAGLIALLTELDGHRCETAWTLSQAVDLLNEKSFDVVLTNSQLGYASPGLLIKHLRRISPRIAVLFLSESGGAISAADAWLRAPFAPKDFFQVIARVLGAAPEGGHSTKRLPFRRAPQELLTERRATLNRKFP